MSRQEEEKKTSGPSGKAIAAGLAVTALGVGIGTALYYFFNKDEEETNAGTSSEWEAQQRLQEAERLKEMRKNKFRARTYTLEECSICFDVMLKDEELLGLPCTHNFHLKCITPWLQEHQTCPVCREQSN